MAEKPEQAQEVAAQGITFPIGCGVTIEESPGFGAWRATDRPPVRNH
jgi:hypothetical protein